VTRPERVDRRHTLSGPRTFFEATAARASAPSHRGSRLPPRSRAARRCWRLCYVARLRGAHGRGEHQGYLDRGTPACGGARKPLGRRDERRASPGRHHRYRAVRLPFAERSSHDAGMAGSGVKHPPAADDARDCFCHLGVAGVDERIGDVSCGRPREFADGLDDRIRLAGPAGSRSRRATAAGQLSPSGRGESAGSVRPVTAGALVAEFVR
jgi:hypothetical protein